MVQVFVALISDWVAGKRDDPLAAVLSTFTLGAVSLVLIAETTVLSFGHQSELFDVVNRTLLGSIFCVLNENGCVTNFRIVVWIVAIVVGLLVLIMAALLKGTIKSSHTPNKAEHLGLLCFSAIPFSISFLLLHQWEGEVVRVNTNLYVDDPKLFREFYSSQHLAQISAAAILGALSAMLAFSALAYAMLLQVGLRRLLALRLPSPLNLSAASVAAGFFVELLRMMLIALVVVIVALLATIGIGSLAAGLVVLAVAIGGAFSIAFSAALRVITSLNLAFWVLLMVIGTYFVSFAILSVATLRHSIDVRQGFVINAMLALRQLFIRLRGFIFLCGGIAFLFLLSSQLEDSNGSDEYRKNTDTICGVCLPPRLSPTAQNFEEVRLTCNARNAFGGSYWAYGSTDYLTHNLRACSLSGDAAPTTIIVIGLASRDDSPEAALSLSFRRAHAAAQTLNQNHPNATIILVAMGRNRGPLIPIAGYPDMYLRDREIVIFAASERVPTPIPAEPLDSVVTRLSAARGLLSNFEFCLMQRYIDGQVPEHLATKDAPMAACLWTN